MDMNGSFDANSQFANFLKPQAVPEGAGRGGVITNGIANMIKALGAGNMDRMRRSGAPTDADMHHMRGVNPMMASAGPMTPTPSMPPITPPVMPTSPAAMNGAQQPPVPMPQPRPVFDAGAAPAAAGGVDPFTAALFSQIPGVSGG